MSSEGGVRVGVDVGGTFTDCVVIDSDGAVHVTKASSTLPQSGGVIDAVGKQDISLSDVTEFIHGTTVATNAMLERLPGHSALLVTEGTGDVLEIQTGGRSELYALGYQKPRPVLDRDSVIEVTGRLDASGKEIAPLDYTAALAMLDRLVDAGCRSVGICLLFSYINPEHEDRLRAAIAARYGDRLAITRSSKLFPEWKEYERASTTALNAYLIPHVAGYMTDLEVRLAASGLNRQFFVMQSNGGLMTSRAAQQYPYRLLFSGPSGGAQAGAMTAAAVGYANALTLDMGGTSTDIALVENEAVGVRYSTDLNYGVPVKGSAIDIQAISSGGGSIARVDSGRLLVGPESAGSQPGPACYGRGGKEATFIDAAVVMGWLDPQHPLAGGELVIDPGLARSAVAAVGKALGVDARVAATGIARVAISRIVEACHSACIGRGRDPRQLALVAFGGAGPLVAPLVAEELGMAAVIVPPHPGAHSAVGLLMSEFKYDFSLTRPARGVNLTSDFLEQAFDGPTSEANELLSAEGLDSRSVWFARSVEARYVGQTHTVDVELPLTATSRESITARFHSRHEALYSYAIPDREVEFTTWRLSVRIPREPLPPFTAPVGEPATSRAIREIELEWEGQTLQAPVLDRGSLSRGAAIEGPALIVQMDSSVFVIPGGTATVHDTGDVVITTSKRTSVWTQSQSK